MGDQSIKSLFSYHFFFHLGRDIPWTIAALSVLRHFCGLLTDHVAIGRSVPPVSFVSVSSVMIVVAAFASLNQISSLSLRLAFFSKFFNVHT